VVSGLGLDIYMQKHIFGPLGMKDTAFFLDGRTAKGKQQLDRLVPCFDFAPGFGCRNSNFVHRDNREKCPKGLPQLLLGGGGLVSTLDDFNAFCQALLKDGEGILDSLLTLTLTLNPNLNPNSNPNPNPNPNPNE